MGDAAAQIPGIGWESLALSFASLGVVCVLAWGTLRLLAGRGIGKALITALLEQGKKMGCTSMRLDTTKLLTSAVRLYQALGFEEISPYHEYQNVPKDLQLFMGKALV